MKKKKVCSECGRKLGIIRRYIHPLNKDKEVCGKCLIWIAEGLKNYENCLVEGFQHNNKCYFWDLNKLECKHKKEIKEISK